MIKRICVFCGSASGNNPAYEKSAYALGASLARAGNEIVYGGASVGLMGAVANGALEQGGSVIGIIPQSLMKKEVAHTGIADLKVVASMHARKALMEELSDAMIALPGGFGTLDELFEILTWRQLGFHQKPLGFLNVENYFDPLMTFVDHIVEQGFVKPEHRALMSIADDPETLLTQLEKNQPPVPEKWR